MNGSHGEFTRPGSASLARTVYSANQELQESKKVHAGYVRDFRSSMLDFSVRVEDQSFAFREVACAANDLKVGKGVFSQAGYRYDVVDFGSSQLLRRLPDRLVRIARGD